MMPVQVQSNSPTAHGLMPPGPVQFKLLQHGCVVEQDWPSCEQTPESPCGCAPSVTPPSGGGVIGLPHVPTSAPFGMMQVRPRQQSELEVQTIPFCSHIEPQRRTPFMSGTHGSL